MVQERKEIKKLMLSELRCVTCRFEEDGAPDFDTAMTKAMTVNENLLSLGYTLKPADIVRLAGSPSLDTFFEEFEELLGDVKAEPMYPGFPQQVMEMSEAQFRFDQVVHYLSTYGMESLFDARVTRGWLPGRGEQEMVCEETSEKDMEAGPLRIRWEDKKEDAGEKAAGGAKGKSDDERLLAAKVLELLDEEAVFVLAKRILRRRERMTLPEQEFVLMGLSELTLEELGQIDIPFKENLREIFLRLTDSSFRPKGDAPGEADSRVLRALCKHTGDVLKCTACLLGYNGYHLRTSQKRFIVKLLESYPEADFRANLALSRKKARLNLAVLQHLDYNLYSRSAAHKEVVRVFRDGKLRSWEGQARARLAAKEEGALDFVAKRPGMMLRMTAWLVRLGYPVSEITEKLCAGAEALSGQTLMTMVRHFGSETSYKKKLEWWNQWHDRQRIALESHCGNECDEDWLKAQNKADDKYEARRKYLKAEMDAVYGILREVLPVKIRSLDTPLKGKKVFLDMEEYDLACSELLTNDKSKEGGYVRSGIAYRIPESVNRLRFFVYWDDRDRVDVDLHAGAYTIDGRLVSIGWNSGFRAEGIVSSGDITHSNAAEYIDVDLTRHVLRDVTFNINLYSGKNAFSEIQTCFVGMMAVKKLGQDVKLYNPANCFFSHELRGKYRKMHYGYVDAQRRCLVFVGQEDRGSGYYSYDDRGEIGFSLQDYLDCLLEGQDATVVQRREDADLVLKMGKAESEQEISFIDQNYFLDK